jgi:hypothetical protein
LLALLHISEIVDLLYADYHVRRGLPLVDGLLPGPRDQPIRLLSGTRLHAIEALCAGARTSAGKGHTGAS